MNIPSTKDKKKPYAPPLLDIYQYEVEHGFAESPEALTMGETFSEINDQSEADYGHAGENYHGEWY
jgi:hypothetical protein